MNLRSLVGRFWFVGETMLPAAGRLARWLVGWLVSRWVRWLVAICWAGGFGEIVYGIDGRVSSAH